MPRLFIPRWMNFTRTIRSSRQWINIITILVLLCILMFIGTSFSNLFLINSPISSNTNCKLLYTEEQINNRWKVRKLNQKPVWPEFKPFLDQEVKLINLSENMNKFYQKIRKGNYYGVKYKRKTLQVNRLKPVEYLLFAKNINFRSVQFGNFPFTGEKWKGMVSTDDFYTQLPKAKSCAVVTPSPSLRNLNLGKEIDRHDTVLRFNAAPTKRFERDYGTKTTIRIANSKSVKNNPVGISELDSENTSLIVVDYCHYGASLNQWFNSPEHNFFESYLKIKKAKPERKMIILHPQTLWEIWEFLQDHTEDQLPIFPTSTGFIGVVLMTQICDYVHVYGFLPSPLTASKKCYYYSHSSHEMCIYGNGHPYLYEKNMMVKINIANVSDIVNACRITIPGISMINCG